MLAGETAGATAAISSRDDAEQHAFRDRARVRRSRLQRRLREAADHAPRRCESPGRRRAGARRGVRGDVRLHRLPARARGAGDGGGRRTRRDPRRPHRVRARRLHRRDRDRRRAADLAARPEDPGAVLCARRHRHARAVPRDLHHRPAGERGGGRPAQLRPRAHARRQRARDAALRRRRQGHAVGERRRRRRDPWPPHPRVRRQGRAEWRQTHPDECCCCRASAVRP